MVETLHTISIGTKARRTDVELVELLFVNFPAPTAQARNKLDGRISYQKYFNTRVRKRLGCSYFEWKLTVLQ